MLDTNICSPMPQKHATTLNKRLTRQIHMAVYGETYYHFIIVWRRTLFYLVFEVMHMVSCVVLSHGVSYIHHLAMCYFHINVYEMLHRLDNIAQHGIRGFAIEIAHKYNSCLR
jgi:hypothetical protein